MQSPPPPAPSTDPQTLPHPLTFFLTASDRARVLRTLRAIEPDRSRALLAALGLREHVAPRARRSP